ncbi:MAG: diguanylate cyclase [Lachnospiraceae bacterium]|nr:diguanylate cyclase [Lachnospiraceae bacterium]
MKKQKNRIEHLYIFLIILVFCLLLLTYIQVVQNKAGNVTNKKTSYNITYLDDLSYFDGNMETEIDDINDLDTDNYVFVKGTFPTDMDYNAALGFHSIHQHVSVKIKENETYTEIYEFSRPKSKLGFGYTPGHAYNIIDNIYEYAGKDFLIQLYSPYGISYEDIPNFIIGSNTNIVLYGLKESSLVLCSSFIIFLLGIFSLFIFVIFKKYIIRGDLTLLYAGIFSIVVSIWTINEQPIMSYFLNNSILTAYLSYISLLLVAPSIYLFFRELCKTKENPIWDISLIISYLNLIIHTFLHILNIADFKECLPTIQIVFLVTAIVIFIYSAYITFKKRTTDGWINFICVICLYIGYFLYLYSYYTDQTNKLYYGSTFIIIYLIVIITLYIRKSITYMIKSDQAEFYENLAYKDSLTNLFNRLAYDTAIANVDVKKASYIIVIFDLNNLKHFNDVYGHTIGDTYIIDSSAMIKQAFADLGNVYRIGGDEFCIIMEDKSIFQYETATRTLDTLTYNYNKVSDVLKINIAYGYAQYDKSIDRDIYETRNRADAMMYEKKFFMKQNQVPLI